MDRLKNSDFFCIAAFFALLTGIVIGSVYLTKTALSSGEGIKEYLGSFVSTGAETDKFDVFKKAVTENAIMLALVFVAGFFRLGIVLTAAVIVRRGFIIGFTTASFIKYYGAKGLLAMSATMPSVIILLPAFLIFSSVSVGFSMMENKRGSVVFYVLFTAAVFAVFLAAAASEGYITTSFMSMIFPKQ